MLYSNPPFDKYANEKFGFTVLDNQLSVIWEEDLELPYQDKFFSLGEYMIDENDELYMLCSFNENAKLKEEAGRRAAKLDAKEKGGSYFTYKILNYSPKTKSIKDFEVELDKGNKIVSIGYNIDPNGDINVSGLYGDLNSKGSGIGVFFVKIDHNTKQTKVMNTKGFDKEFLEEYVGEKKAKDGIGVSRLALKNFINRQDGGLIICGEIHYSYQVCTTDSRGVTHCRTVYVRGPIFTINIAPSGEIDWVNIVKKDQRTSIDGYLSSYVLIVGEDGFYYIYNDHMANHNPKKKPKRTAIMNGIPKKAITAVTQVDYDGRSTTNISAELNAKKMLLRPDVSLGVVGADGEKILMLAIGKKGNKKFVEISKK